MASAGTCYACNSFFSCIVTDIILGALRKVRMVRMVRMAGEEGRKNNRNDRGYDVGIDK